MMSRYNHGIQTMYEFAEDVGGLDRSRYFGYSKDLYHFDHFMGAPPFALYKPVDFRDMFSPCARGRVEWLLSFDA